MTAVKTKTLAETNGQYFPCLFSEIFFSVIYSIVRNSNNSVPTNVNDVAGYSEIAPSWLNSFRGLKVNFVISLYTRGSWEGVPVRDAGIPRV